MGGRTIGGRWGSGNGGLRRWQYARLARGAVVADDGRESCLERLAFSESLWRRRRKREVVSVAIILEAYFETHLSCAFFRGKECWNGGTQFVKTKEAHGKLRGTHRRPQHAPRGRREPSFHLESIEDELR